MGPYTMGPVPEVRMWCGPRLVQMGRDCRSLNASTIRELQALGISRSGDPLRIAWEQRGGSQMVPESPIPHTATTLLSAALPLGDLLQPLGHYHSYSQSRDPKSPGPALQAPGPMRPQLFHRTGKLHVRLRTKHQIKEALVLVGLSGLCS